MEHEKGLFWSLEYQLRGEVPALPPLLLTLGTAGSVGVRVEGQEIGSQLILPIPCFLMDVPCEIHADFIAIWTFPRDSLFRDIRQINQPLKSPCGIHQRGAAK